MRRFGHRFTFRGPEGGVAQMVLYRPTGELMKDGDWQDPGIRTLAVALDGRRIVDEDGSTSSDRFLLCINGHWDPVDFSLPGSSRWGVVLSTSDERAGALEVSRTSLVPARSLVLLQSR